MSDEGLVGALSVFAGGFSAEAAATVCDTGSDDLDRLVAAGALHRDGDRYELRGRGTPDDEVRRRHLRYFLELGEWARERTPGPREEEALDAMRRERDNLVAAGDYALAVGDAEATVRLAKCFQRNFAQPLRVGSDIRRWLEPLLEREDISPSLRASAYGNATLQAGLAGDWRSVQTLGERGAALYRAIDDPEGEAWMLGWLGTAGRSLDDRESERAFQRRVLPLARRAGSAIMLYSALARSASLALEERDLDAAESLIDELTDVAASFDSPDVQADVETLDGLLSYRRGDLAHALARLLTALRHWHSQQQEAPFASTLRPVAAVLAAAAQGSTAVALVALSDTRQEAMARWRGPKWELYRDEALAAAALLDKEATAAAQMRGASWNTDNALRNAERAAAAII